jgi:putative nucleotidyltransferase with HDIG domain
MGDNKDSDRSTIMRGTFMYKEIKNPPLINEEERALKWFLTLFYLIYIIYEVFYHAFYKQYEQGLPKEVNIWMYLWLLIILPLPFYFRRREKIYLVKYVFVIGYFITSMFSELLIYSNHNSEFQSGNAVEILAVLFTPFFVNSRFYTVVMTAILSKYIALGIILESGLIFAPVIMVLLLGGIAFILLKRFQSYVGAIKKSFDSQLEGIVKGVIATIELKDPYTRGHSERVAYYANSLALETGRLTEEELSSFNYACLLHDIGKVNIPDSILMKPGKLSKEEFNIIKTHPAVGAEAITKVNGLENSIDVIKSHHERWDGKGYPENLKGTDIPFIARIVSIADAFDAMTSSRSYRDALSVMEAYKRIIDGKGTQFDPHLVDLFIKVYPEWVEFHEKYEWTTASVPQTISR